jgi:tetratricopeptide (TPR) repeat protein
VMADPDAAIAWNEKALALAHSSSQPEAKRWLPSLLNNQGWSYFERHDYQRALALFEEALELRSREDNAEATRIARWSVAKTLRVLGKVEQALEMQQAILSQYAGIGKTDGFVFEELGECQLARGETAQARDWFVKAYTELSKDSDFAQREAPRLARMRSLGGL